ncbi:YqzK family protein, partial [Bacillus inaquosorum]|nr:YqzK family protein [Bacillus inaquosorum]
VNQEYENYHRYDKPEGSAVKVVEMDQDEKGGWFDRLIFFYQNGE